MISSTRNNAKLPVNLKTGHFLPVPQTTYYVTVTGEFRDGTEQVLLVQRVTLPEVSEKGQVNPNPEGFVVIPYVFTSDDKYPGHGFIQVLPEGMDPQKDSWWKGVTFTVTAPSLGSGNELKVNGSSGLAWTKNTDGSSSYDIRPINSGSGWELYPYPVDKNFWALDTLEGTVNIPATLTTEATTAAVTIGQRVNIFEDLDVGYTLTAIKKQNKVYTLKSTSTGEPESYNWIGYVVKRNGGSIEQYSYGKTEVGLNNNEITWGKNAKLDNYNENDVVEVYVREPILAGGSNTYVWHKIHNTTIGYLKSTLPTP